MQTAKSAAQRKADERARMRIAGFIQKTVWVHAEDWPRVVKYLNAVSRRREKGNR